MGRNISLKTELESQTFHFSISLFKNSVHCGTHPVIEEEQSSPELFFGHSVLTVHLVF